MTGIGGGGEGSGRETGIVKKIPETSQMTNH